jgi:hypothetical protein
MGIRCSILGHIAGTGHHYNQGLCFATCHGCGCDLIRPEGGRWSEVPVGFRVVWRDFGHARDAEAVAARMARIAPPPRRRLPRDARPALPRDRRSWPISDSANVFGTLTHLRSLLCEECGEDDEDFGEARHDFVICLPGAGMR